MGGGACRADVQLTSELAGGVLAGQCAQDPGASRSQYCGQPILAVVSGVDLCPARGTSRIDKGRLGPAHRDGRACPDRRHQAKPPTSKVDIGFGWAADLQHSVTPTDPRMERVQGGFGALGRELPGPIPQLGRNDLLDRGPHRGHHVVVVDPHDRAQFSQSMAAAASQVVDPRRRTGRPRYLCELGPDSRRRRGLDDVERLVEAAAGLRCEEGRDTAVCGNQVDQPTRRGRNACSAGPPQPSKLTRRLLEDLRTHGQLAEWCWRCERHACEIVHPSRSRSICTTPTGATRRVVTTLHIVAEPVTAIVLESGLVLSTRFGHR